MSDAITTAIARLTRRLHAYRVFEGFKRGDIEMPLEIKGPKARRVPITLAAQA